MAIRNFYLNADIDGRKTRLTGGPSSKDGGMALTVTQRRNGEIVKAYSIESYVTKDGRLKTTVYGQDGGALHSFTTDR